MYDAHFANDVVPVTDGAGRDTVALRRPRVLLADDHRALLDCVAMLLARDFLIVGTVSDGDELVSAAAALNPDILVMDISMPRVSGLEAAARIRASGSNVPIVCLTAHVDEEYVEAAIAAGARGYVTKPAIARDLVPAIRAVLAGGTFLSESVRRTAVRGAV
jgi:DNA-binding NarL/FixJ family response regulator